MFWYTFRKKPWVFIDNKLGVEPLLANEGNQAKDVNVSVWMVFWTLRNQFIHQKVSVWIPMTPRRTGMSDEISYCVDIVPVRPQIVPSLVRLRQQWNLQNQAHFPKVKLRHSRKLITTLVSIVENHLHQRLVCTTTFPYTPAGLRLTAKHAVQVLWTPSSTETIYRKIAINLCQALLMKERKTRKM